VGDVSGAIDEYRTILGRQPDLSEARLHLATALMAKQDWTGARAELDEVIRRSPDLLQAHYNLGVVRYTLGDLAGAIGAYRRVLELDPDQADARLGMALALRLHHRDAEASRELLAAARAGLPRAQHFLGTAYATGLGVGRDLALAVTWWFQAADGGVREAEDALAQLRQTALGRGRAAPAQRRAAEQAFASFRAGLWAEFPELPRSAEESAGLALLTEGRTDAALLVLIREARALGEPAQRRLESLYEEGIPGQIAPYDARILDYVKTAAAEGQVRPRIVLARIYGRGLGVPKDVARATALLRSTPHEDAQRLLRDLGSEGAARDGGPRNP
jgi:TPR repeat protein